MFVWNKNEIIDEIKEFQRQNIKFNDFENKKLLKGKDFKILYSPLDRLGEVVINEKERKVFRAIRKESVERFIELYESGILQALAKFKLFPKIKLTDYYIENHPIVVEIEYLDIIHHKFWTYSMIKEEMELKLFLIDVLKEFNYGLIDGYWFNSTFKNNAPVFFDIGSIVKNSNNKVAKYGIINNNFLALMMLSLNDPFLQKDIIDAIAFRPKIRKSPIFKSIVRRFSNPFNFFALMRIMKRNNIKLKDSNRFFDERKYYKKLMSKDNSETSCVPVEVLEKTAKKISALSNDCASFIDLAGKDGYLSSLVKNNTSIEDITSADSKEIFIEKGRIKFKDKPFGNFVLFNPMQEQYRSNFKKDIVCALDMTEYILLKLTYYIDNMLYKLKDYSKKYIFIDFCPLGLSSDKAITIPEYYNETWFENHFKLHFDLMEKEVIETTLINCKETPKRILFIGKVKD